MDPNQHTPQNLSGTFDGVLSSFGADIPQISTFITFALGSIGFDKYFNAGAWAIILNSLFRQLQSPTYSAELINR